MKSTVSRRGAQQFTDRLDTPLSDCIGALHDQARRSHANNQSMAETVKRSRCFLNYLIGGCRAAGQESRAKPPNQMIGGDIVGGDDDHTATTPTLDPVLCQRHSLRGARASRVQLRVRAAGSNELGELRVSHRQGPQQESPVENVWVLL